jgi:hypothetical protein
MQKLIVIFLLLFSLTAYAQKPLSIQVNGGFINPIDSHKGLSGSVQFNYSLNSKFNLYFYSGYSNWDRNKIIFYEEMTGLQTQQYFPSYSKDNHKLMTFNFGGKINLHTNKIFTSFVNIELGYSHLSYTKYLVWNKGHAESGEVIGYYVDPTAKIDVNDDLFGVGLGGGVFRNIGNNISLVLSFKLNSFLNSNYEGLFTRKGTYTMFLAGFNFAV